MLCCAQVQARIQHLRELQDKHDEYEGAYHKELRALQAKFAALYGARMRAPTPIPSKQHVMHASPRMRVCWPPV